MQGESSNREIAATPVPFTLPCRHGDKHDEYRDRVSRATHPFMIAGGLSLAGFAWAVGQMYLGGIHVSGNMVLCVALLLAGGVGLVGASVALTRETTLSYDRSTGEVTIRQRVWSRARILASANAKDIRVAVHATTVLVTDGPPRMSWHGFAVVVECAGLEFVVAAVRDEQAAIGLVEAGPDWLRRRYVGKGPDLHRRGDRRWL